MVFAESSQELPPRIVSLVKRFHDHSEDQNKANVQTAVDEAVTAQDILVEKMLVLDGDKTLAAEDTGELFWKQAQEKLHLWEGIKRPVADLFNTTSYSYYSFRRAALLHEQHATEEQFEQICEAVASQVVLHAEFADMLDGLVDNRGVGAVVVTARLRRIWQKILQKANLGDAVRVLGVYNPSFIGLGIPLPRRTNGFWIRTKRAATTPTAFPNRWLNYRSDIKIRRAPMVSDRRA